MRVVVVSAVQVIVLQILPSVLATVFNVLVLVQTIAVQQIILYVLAPVVFVMVLAQNIAVREVMVFVQVLLVHATVQVVVQYGIVSHVLTVFMQPVVIISVARHHYLLPLVTKEVLLLME